MTRTAVGLIGAVATVIYPVTLRVIFRDAFVVIARKSWDCTRQFCKKEKQALRMTEKKESVSEYFP